MTFYHIKYQESTQSNHNLMISIKNYYLFPSTLLRVQVVSFRSRHIWLINNSVDFQIISTSSDVIVPPFFQRIAFLTLNLQHFCGGLWQFYNKRPTFSLLIQTNDLIRNTMHFCSDNFNVRNWWCFLSHHVSKILLAKLLPSQWMKYFISVFALKPFKAWNMSLNEKLPKGTETLKCIGLHKIFDFHKILHMMLVLLL